MGSALLPGVNILHHNISCASIYQPIYLISWNRLFVNMGPSNLCDGMVTAGSVPCAVIRLLDFDNLQMRYSG